MFGLFGNLGALKDALPEGGGGGPLANALCDRIIQEVGNDPMFNSLVMMFEGNIRSQPDDAIAQHLTRLRDLCNELLNGTN